MRAHRVPGRRPGHPARVVYQAVPVSNDRAATAGLEHGLMSVHARCGACKRSGALASAAFDVHRAGSPAPDSGHALQADPAAGRLGRVSQPLAEPVHLPPATERQVRSHAAELVELAARHGITVLAFASPGRLRGHLADDRDLFDMFEFQRAAADLLDAEVTVYSDGALTNQHVSPDLVAATPL